ncbi:MAG: hypothetical protein M1821_001851 [Bathelium mastoideum]|nr:MAG: hypothetical protein M1821_001851 [Bathelium mastoideum]
MEHPPKRQRISKTGAQWRNRRGHSGRTSADKPQFVHQASDAVPTAYEAQWCEDCFEPVQDRASTRHSRKISEGKGTIFHRRQATDSAESAASLGLTVTVQAQVDGDGSTATVVTLPTVPTVVSYPSNLTPPAVPTESSFPALTVPTVPSYPFTVTTSQVITSAGTVIPEASAAALSTGVPPSESSESVPGEGMIGFTATGNSGSTQVVLSPPPTPNPSAPSASPFPSSSNSTQPVVSAAGISTASSSTIPPNENVTTSAFTTYPDGVIGFSTIDLGPMSTTESPSSTITASSQLGSSAISSSESSASETSSRASASTGTLSSLSSSSGASSTATSGSSSQPSSTGSTGGAGGGSASSASGTPSGSSGSAPSGAPATANSTTPTPTSVVVGGVVGGVAGVAVLLLLALLLLRWYKRRGQVRQPLAGDDGEAPGAVAPMSDSSARFPPLIAAAGLLHRFSAPRTPPEPPQRGFQRVSGRKIPSMFSGARPDSEPIDPFADPIPSTIPTDASFYRDSEGFFGIGTDAAAAGSSGAHEPPSDESAVSGAAPSAAEAEEKFMPGPARTPVLHPGGPYSPVVVDPPPEDYGPPEQPPPRMLTPTSATAVPGTLGRSHPSFDGSRGSRFTENVE